VRRFKDYFGQKYGKPMAPLCVALAALLAFGPGTAFGAFPDGVEIGTVTADGQGKDYKPAVSGDYVTLQEGYGLTADDPFGGTTVGIIIHAKPGQVGGKDVKVPFDGAYAIKITPAKAESYDYSVVGGISFTDSGKTIGMASGNNVIIGDKATIGKTDTGSVFGGLIENLGKGKAIIENNTVTTSGIIGRSVYGGFSRADGEVTVTGNKVVVGGGTVKGTGTTSGIVAGGAICAVDGGNCKAVGGTLSKNVVEINNGEVAAVYGAIHGQGNEKAMVGGIDKKSGNAVIIKGGLVDSVAGGSGSGAAVVSNNTVTMSKGTVKTTIFGGQGQGDVSFNEVTITGGSLGEANLVEVIGGGNNSQSSKGEVTKNTVTIDNSSAALNGTKIGVIGGKSTGEGNVTGNEVMVTKADVAYVIGGVLDNAKYEGTNSGNIVTLSDVNVKKDPGINDSGNVYGGSGKSGKGSKNSITFQGKENNVEKDVYGAHGATVKENNTVTFAEGKNVIGGAVKVYGDLIIQNGDNTIGDEVDTLQKGKNITVTGGKTTFKGDVKAEDGKIDVTKGAITLDSALERTFTADSFTLGKGSSFGFTKESKAVITAKTTDVKDGGVIEFKTTGASLTVTNGLDVSSGGEVVFAATGNKLTAKSLAVKSGGTVSLSAPATVSIAPSGTIFSEGTISLGKNKLTVDGSPDVTYKNGSVIEFGTEGDKDYGQIAPESGKNLNITYESGSKFILAPVAGNPDYWVNKVLVEVGTGGKQTSHDKINAGFYELVLDKGADNKLVVGATKKTFQDVLKNEDINLSQNLVAASELMQKISRASGTDKALADLGAKLEATVIDITNKYAPEKAEEALRQLIGESLVNVPTAVTTSVLKTQGVVYNRLDRIRAAELGGMTPPAAGRGSELNRLWGGGFGTWAEEDNANRVSGYKFSSGGVALGYDHQVAGLPGLRLGLSGAYSNGKIKNNDGRTTVDLDTLGIGVYGSYTLPNNVFFDASVGYANTKNDYETSLITGGSKSGSFNVNSWQYGFRFGVIAQGDNWQITPSAGIKYVVLRQGAFADTLNDAAKGNTLANRYKSREDHQVDIPLLVKFNTTVQAGSVIITPELRLGYSFAVKRPDNSLDVGFVGATDTAKIVGTRARDDSFQAGVGLKINTGSTLDVFANYDLETSRGYHSHNASLGLGFEF
jgi:outer membrane autotransporter protein